MVTIATYNEPAKARRLKEKFKAAGVKADLHNEANLQTYAFMSKPKANAQVMVAEEDFERAQNLMVEWEAADPDIAAAILKPFVDEKLHWIVERHGIFQGYYFYHYLGLDRDMREQFRGHPHFEETARFCEIYDQAAFDETYDSAPLDFFEPMVRRVFAAPKSTIYVTEAE